MDSNVTIKIDALDNSKAAFASLASSIEGVKKSTAGVSEHLERMAPVFRKVALIGTAAFAGIVVAGNKSIQAYAEVERSQRQLEHAVIGVSKGTKEQVVQINALTAALEKKAGVDADSLNMGVAQLSTFGLSTQSVIGLTKSLADLTVNQNGLNAGSEEYIQNANTIAKALNGQFGILEKSGIRFNEAQQNLILYGTEAQKVSAIQEGFAQNLRETTDTVSGVDLATAKMHRTMENISENLGKALVPAFAKLTETLQPIIERFADWSEKNPELLAKMVLIGGAVASLAVVLGTLGLILPPIIAGIGLLATSYSFLSIALFGAGAASATATPAFVAAGVAVNAMLLPITAVIAAAALLGAGIYLLWQNWDKATSLISTATEAVTSYVSDTFRAAMDAISSAVSTAWQFIKDVFFTSINFIIGGWATLLDFLVPGWDGMLLSLFTSVTAVFSQIRDFMASIFLQISETFGGWSVAFLEIWSGIWSSAKGIFSEIWTSLATVFDSIVSGIKSAMETLVAPIQKVIDLAERALSLAGGVVKKASGYVSSTVSSILARGSSITGKASGGPVSGNTPYIVGEVGPELFVPSSSGRIVPNNQLGSAGGTVINQVFNIGRMIGEKQYALEMGNAIIQTMKQNQRL